MTAVASCGLPPRPGSYHDAPPATVSGGAALVVEPDDGAEAVLQIIRGAARSVHGEMYLLTDDDAVQALVDARHAGLEVQVILEPHPFQADGANQDAYQRLTAAGADVTWASARFALTHAKAIVADGRRAAVMTLNLTHAGLHTNREYVILDEDAGDVAALEAIFAADRVGAAAPQPPPAIRLIASPSSGRAALATLITGTTRSLAIEMEELSDGDMVGAIAAAVARGVGVTVVLPGSGLSSSTEAAARRLGAAGASVRLLAAPDVHAKAIVADGTRLYVGSINLTAASLDANREVGVVLGGDALTAARVAATIAAYWARAEEL